MAKFRLKPTPVEAVQLRWDTWNEMCEHTAAPCTLSGQPVGCYVDPKGNETEDTNGRMGLKIPRPASERPDGVEIAVQDDWIVRMNGELVVYRPDAFTRLFEIAPELPIEMRRRCEKIAQKFYSEATELSDTLLMDVAIEAMSEYARVRAEP